MRIKGSLPHAPTGFGPSGGDQWRPHRINQSICISGFYKDIVDRVWRTSRLRLAVSAKALAKYVNNPRTDIDKPVFMTDLQMHWYRLYVMIFSKIMIQYCLSLLKNWEYLFWFIFLFSKLGKWNSDFSFCSQNCRNCFKYSRSLLDWTFLPLVNDTSKFIFFRNTPSPVALEQCTMCTLYSTIPPCPRFFFLILTQFFYKSCSFSVFPELLFCQFRYSPCLFGWSVSVGRAVIFPSLYLYLYLHL